MVTVASIEQTPNIDAAGKFRGLLNLFAEMDLSGGAVNEFGPFRMSGFSGLSARLTGHRA
ncbi:MAG: hypothetical protein HXX15_23000, partial [Rhodopseudomonas sp.]|nr:hypothetical protein [Rhodopseudomonas sp.]